jgi:hypothetical protein
MDTESDPVTKEPLSIQWKYGGESGVITHFDSQSYSDLSYKWNSADAVVFFNAPYDMGVLSICYPGMNSFEWIDNKSGQFWLLNLYNCSYRVRRIAGFRNFIRPMGKICDDNGKQYARKARKPKSTPVIDLLKCWSILVDDGEKHSISLKSLIERELHVKAIHYTPEVALTLEYQLQDVDRLSELWELFLSRVSSIEGVSGYSYAEWGAVKTPATFTKLAYEAEYPLLKGWQSSNSISDDKYTLHAALERAYHGGLTISLKRGVSDKTAWYDIHGAYAHVIEYENTDQYLYYHWSEVGIENIELPRDNCPILCHITTNALIETIGKSLKVFRLNTPSGTWAWSYDIHAIRLLMPGAKITIDRAYRLCADNPVSESLPTRWSRQKEQEEAAHGKTTLREFLKFLSNTSYGIKAQRKPYTTKHTNMAVAGLITARAHLILAEMIDEAQKHGCTWIYSDTDSICVEHENQDMIALESAINWRIAPYSAGCEGYEMKTRILSLKRYTSTGGRNTDGTPAHEKIRLHGRSQYKVSQSDILSWTTGGKPSPKPLMLSSVAANTLRTLNRVLKLNPLTAPNKPPFMFETGIRSDRSAEEWFNAWYAHIDTKTTYIDGAGVEDEFYRDIRIFGTLYEAYSFYRSKIVDDYEAEPPIEAYVDWDSEDVYAFDSPPDA